MKWSFRIANIAGISLNIHITFGLIVVLGALQWAVPHGVAGALFGALLILLLFACVTLHELGHALAARWFGIPVREIILLPLGGIAFLERQPSRPLHELVIALAGPLVNVLIAAGQARGELAADFSPESAADFFLSVFEGSILLAKARRDPQALEASFTMLVRYLETLRPKAASSPPAGKEGRA
jgi:Zn-dependent protease